MSPKSMVYYDYFDGNLAPMWFVIKFKRGSLDWSKKNLYVSIETPFERQNTEDFDSSVMGISIIDSDLILNASKPNCFGIHLPFLRKRAEEELFIDIWEVEQILIQVSDIEEILQMNVFSKKTV